jgi:peroxiredoxin (alkyl hydroperoxide reductase subunit C)
MVALVQRAAPVFKADAVVNGSFQEISLSNLLGQW